MIDTNIADLSVPQHRKLQTTIAILLLNTFYEIKHAEGPYNYLYNDIFAVSVSPELTKNIY